MSETENPLIEGRTAVIECLRQLMVASANAGVRRIHCVAPSFLDWPFDQSGVLEALVRWAKPPGRAMLLIAQDFDGVGRQHPRFTAWRRDWAHCIEALQPSEGERVELPTLLWAGMQALEVLDTERWRARWLRDPAELRAKAELCEAIAQRCEAAWPATTLGL